MTAKGEIIVRMESVDSIVGASQRALDKALKIVASEIETYIKTKVGRPSPPRSRPGQYPHQETGEFQDGISVTATRNYVTIRSAVDYGMHLETGTRNMEARPWAERALFARNWSARIAKLARQYTGGSRKRSK